MGEQLTREQILAMEPGRELDKLVNEKLFGYIVRSHVGYEAVKRVDRAEFLPSTYLPNAWEVVEKVRDTARAHIDIELFHDSRIDGRVIISDMEDKEDIILPYGQAQKAGFPKTLTEAICKAALLAVMDL